MIRIVSEVIHLNIVLRHRQRFRDKKSCHKTKVTKNSYEMKQYLSIRRNKRLRSAIFPTKRDTVFI